MSETARIIDTEPAVPRYQLKAAISAAGYKWFYQFAEEAELHPVTLSRVINGWEYPSPGLQKRLAEGLGLTIRELRELL